ncbi:MAG: sigma 54-interacting transcriptional regulator, partial [Acidobacteria bacterium]|nr:sigma 54-interacting transcriptional regulator [Acidobacteriota bacterium]
MGQTIWLAEEETLIGREVSATVCIGDLSVSRQHCRIRRDGDNFQVTDLESLNGTFVNGGPVAERPLAHGDQLKIGDSCFSFLLHDETALPSPTSIQWDEDADAGAASATVELRREDSIYLQPEKTLSAAFPSPRIAQNFNALLRISGAIHSLQDSEALASHLLKLIFEIIPAEQGVVLLTGSDGGFSLIAKHGTAAITSNAPVSRTVLNRVTAHRLAILDNHVLEGSELKQAASLLSAQVRSVLAVPLLLYEKVTGVIYLVTRNRAVRFDEDHLQVLTAIAGMAAVALENAQHLEELNQENRRLQNEINLQHGMVGESTKMREVLQFIAKVAPTDSTVLICGESGTGKELVARAIHQNSPRCGKPFVAINCAALIESLLESELFGYEKGAFTNALSQKKGKLETAEGGTVFLDEVGELAPALQAKLLRVLQEREFDRVGGVRPVQVNVRVIAATNRNLEDSMRAGSFRTDLYFRLNVVSFTVPPLRDRRQDIPLLASYFINKHSKQARRRVNGLTRQARAILIAYDWPGNVRELENAIERAVVLGSTEVLLPE